MEDPVSDREARAWADRLLAHADALESAALEWKVRGTGSAPVIDFAIPHAAIVMDLARSLRDVARRTLADFPEEQAPGSNS